MSTTESIRGAVYRPFMGLGKPKPLADCPVDCIPYKDVYALATSKVNEPKHPIYGIVKNGRYAPVRSFILPREAINQNKRAKQDVAIEWSLPAHGEKGHQCGRFVPHTGIACCPEGHVIEGTVYRCGRLECPVCYPWAVLRASSRIANSLRAAYLLNGEPVINHMVISPPQKRAKSVIGTEQGYKSLSREAQGIAQDLGVLGGSVIFHPWRQNGEKDESDLDSIEEGKVSKDSTWRLGPHFHVVGLGRVDLEKVARLYKTHGWVVKVLSFDVEPDRLENVLAYCLSHAGIGHVEGHKYALHVSGAFGICSSRSLAKVSEYKTYETKECPCCGRTLQDYEKWMDYIEYGTPPKDATKVKRTLVYCKREDLQAVRSVVSHMNREEVMVCAVNDPRMVIINPWTPKDIEPDSGPPRANCPVPSPCSGSLLSYLRG